MLLSHIFHMCRDMKWNDHIGSVVGKAGGRLRFVGKILGKCHQPTKEIAYKALVRPILEYCSSVWDPYQIGPAMDIERIQRRAARMVTGLFDTRERITEMLKYLGRR